MTTELRLYKRHFIHSSFTGNGFGTPCPIEKAIMEATELPDSAVSMGLNNVEILGDIYATTWYGPETYKTDKRKALQSKKDCLIRTIAIY